MAKFIISISVFLFNFLFCAEVNPMDRALEITRERIAFYNTRENLFKGSSTEARAFQDAQNGDSATLTCNVGPEKIMGVMTGTVKKLDILIESNNSFRHQWKAIESTLEKIRTGTAEISSLDQFNAIFGARRGIAVSTTSEIVAADTRIICAEIEDFERVLGFVRSFRS